jgi:hypothetical protein
MSDNIRPAKQKTKPCANCPFIKPELGDTSCFHPDSLTRTVVDYLDGGRVHPCHASKDIFCAGYLSYAKYKTPNGLLGMDILMFGINLGLIDPDLITDLDTFDSVPEMLASHQERCETIDSIDKLFGFKPKSTGIGCQLPTAKL